MTIREMALFIDEFSLLLLLSKKIVRELLK